ncbi:MAG: ribonuclease III [Gammaproteobacteria bacterium]|nr:ribonuclease III [Gammaproteobacteria bacterium]HJL80005.1 ribonuclease III [Gammaproteobacteria bacterium]HJM09011.1 ribonuclease III [Gammaproteobacteria bacterium]HJN01355.1 ribonuclease III [Gammaproteobacteria bacterium]
MISKNEHRSLNDKFQYKFNDPKILSRALTHRSHSSENYERLEFLGDAVLDMVLSEALYKHFPELEEGRLSRMRAHLVNQKALAEIARGIELDKHLILGKGERTTGKNRDSILSDSLEALIGGVYIDGGFEKVQAIILKLFDAMILEINPDDLFQDSKSGLQEALQKNNMELPRYNLIKTEGEQHDQMFEVECIVSSINLVTNGIGKNLKYAEQQAAEKALEIILNHDD